ncbi:hypothetical protein AB0F96_30620 [Streptomyces sp. NPDC023998]|uniref:hypothetical protein n=1 Tax=Streptomyces sp. NPDC023998 TaxID=3154597 RepID=UPI0033CF2DB3
MKQPQSVEAAKGAVARRAVAVVLLVLLALLGTSVGSAAAAAGAGEIRTPASAPADPASAGQPEEAATEATGRACPAARPVAPATRSGLRSDPGRAAPYRPGQSRQAQLPLPMHAVRCVVLRC